MERESIWAAGADEIYFHLCLTGICSLYDKGLLLTVIGCQHCLQLIVFVLVIAVITASVVLKSIIEKFSVLNLHTCTFHFPREPGLAGCCLDFSSDAILLNSSFGSVLARWLSICYHRFERKEKEEYLYSAIYTTHSLRALRRGSHSFTCKLNRACLSFVSVHQMASPLTEVADPIAAYYSFIDPDGMKGWVGLVGWL